VSTRGNKLHLAFLVLPALVALLLSGCGNTSSSINGRGNQSALVVIDVQEDATGNILNPPFLYQKDSDVFISKLNKIIEAANNDGVLVIYTRMNQEMKDTPGSELDSRLKVVDNNIFLKDTMDAFSASDHKFRNYLAANKQIKELYIVGLDATLCVNETAKAAVNRGYKTTILSDGITTISSKPMNEILNDYKNNGILVTTSNQVWPLPPLVSSTFFI
jgi:nicotinamidase-related amidase